MGGNVVTKLDCIRKDTHFRRMKVDLVQNREYATSQINDLATKLHSASSTIPNNSSALKLKTAPPSGDMIANADVDITSNAKGKKGKAPQGPYAGVEETETPLSKVAKDRYV